MSNFSDLIGKINELETKRIEKLNQPIIEAMKQSLVLESVGKSEHSDRWGFNKEVLLNLKVKNIGQKEVDEYRATITCRGPSGKILSNLNISDTENIIPGQTGGGFWKKDINMFIPNEDELYKTPESQLNFITQIYYAKFLDGSELRLHQR